VSDGGSQPVRALVVDDEAYLADLVAMALRYEGWEAITAGTGDAAARALREQHPDVVILDVMLPDTDGFSLLRRWRESGVTVPVIFLTARDATDDRVSGLRLGADDYVVKPFSLEELVARVRAVLRRTAPVPASREPLQAGALIVDEDGHDVRYEGQRISLTPTEFELLRFLLRNVGVVVSKTQILDRVWEYDFRGNANVVELYVGYLRRKLEAAGPRIIHTVRGVGYVLRVDAAGAT
jgi:two-component system, OmpR family, response regulator